MITWELIKYYVKKIWGSYLKIQRYNVFSSAVLFVFKERQSPTFVYTKSDGKIIASQKWTLKSIYNVMIPKATLRKQFNENVKCEERLSNIIF